jgi:hypothetical protein
MNTTYVEDRQVFEACLRRAQHEGVPVQIVRMVTTEPHQFPDGTAELRPAVELTYILEFHDGRYTFRETRVADAQGIVRLDGTLWKELTVQPATNQPEVVMLRRSGSL